jgi:hypothetical protein
VTTTKIPTAGAMALAILTKQACIDPSCQCRYSLKEGKGLTHCVLPLLHRHGDKTPSLNISVADRCLWHCFAGCNKDDVSDVIVALDLDASDFEGRTVPTDYGHDKGKLLSAEAWYPPYKPQKPIAIYQYCDESGTALYERLRYETKSGKTFNLRRGPVGHPSTPSYYDKLGDVRRVPYRLPELIGTAMTTMVVMVEGEKAADRLVALGLVVTIYKLWLEDWNQFVIGRRILMLPDNDRIGEEYVADAVKVMGGCTYRNRNSATARATRRRGRFRLY